MTWTDVYMDWFLVGFILNAVSFLFAYGHFHAHHRAEYEPVGALGKLSSVIREGGIGEMIYSQQGSRRSIAARSEDGTGIPKGTEVVITRYEKGIAYVRRWDELAGQ